MYGNGQLVYNGKDPLQYSLLSVKSCVRLAPVPSRHKCSVAWNRSVISSHKPCTHM